MLSLKGHIQLNEARSRGEEMEEFIIAAVNNSKEPKSKYGIPAGAGKNVAKFLNFGIACRWKAIAELDPAMPRG